MLRVDVGGRYYRVADRDWLDPLDPSYAADNPGRWNPRGTPCLYLNLDLSTARANVLRMLVGMPYGPEDLDPNAGPLLVDVDVPAGTALDAYTVQGLVEVGLPTTYPVDADGNVVSHERCQPIGSAALEARLVGVDARSAAPGGTRELAWLSPTRPQTQRVRSFGVWW